MSVDLIILSGFLGSGKTTLLVDFLKQEGGSDTGVIVNEVGEIGIDGAIIADGSDGIPMLTLANGCVCCSLRSSLVHTVGVLLDSPRPAGAPPFRRIILETSGLSKPGPIIASLADPEISARKLRVSVVSTYDCVTGSLNAETFEEAAAQLAAAQRIVFTKVDKVDSRSLEQHLRRAAGVNPLGQIVAETDRSKAVAKAFSSMPESDPVDRALQALRNTARQGLAHPRVHVLAGTVQHEASWSDVAQWLDDLAGLCGERLLRVKALVPVTDCPEPILIQSVGTTFSAPRRMAGKGKDYSAACMVIVRDLDAEYINSVLQGAPITLAQATTQSIL
ncbi:GTP-binding protein [Candidimonas sp. SYP-B2681]|uniref:CobW family GTP-binding protein n=1 Tax=Candidimonas sp. SYP-B2681 TaxID=2497686 RepID=UPI000F898C01|nr:GTP-binding protein [Candidimonas sp. SYP-B2681]RTZ41527.1 GTP-binding protein [Candidimonas sp. SYP-B2681]